MLKLNGFENESNLTNVYILKTYYVFLIVRYMLYEHLLTIHKYSIIERYRFGSVRYTTKELINCNVSNYTFFKKI